MGSEQQQGGMACGGDHRRANAAKLLFWGQSSERSFGRMWIGRVRRLTATRLGDRWEVGGNRARLYVAMVPEGLVRQAVFWGESFGAGLGPMWVRQWLEHGIFFS